MKECIRYAQRIAATSAVIVLPVPASATGTYPGDDGENSALEEPEHTSVRALAGAHCRIALGLGFASGFQRKPPC
jgi:hypothetical protein